MPRQKKLVGNFGRFNGVRKFSAVRQMDFDSFPRDKNLLAFWCVFAKVLALKDIMQLNILGHESYCIT